MILDGAKEPRTGSLVMIDTHRENQAREHATTTSDSLQRGGTTASYIPDVTREGRKPSWPDFTGQPSSALLLQPPSHVSHVLANLPCRRAGRVDPELCPPQVLAREHPVWPSLPSRPSRASIPNLWPARPCPRGSRQAIDWPLELLDSRPIPKREPCFYV